MKQKYPRLRNVLFIFALALSSMGTWVCFVLFTNEDAFTVEDARLDDFRICTEAGQTQDLPDEGFVRMETIEIFVCGDLSGSDNVWIALYWLLPENDDWTQAMPEKSFEPGDFQDVIFPLTAEGFPVGTYPIEARQGSQVLAELMLTIR